MEQEKQLNIKKINLGIVNPLLNMMFLNEKFEANDEKMKMIYDLTKESLTENSFESFISLLLTVREDENFVDLLLKVDIESAEMTFLNIIQNVFKEQENYKTIVVYNSLLHIEEIDYRQFFFSELNGIQLILKNIIKYAFFNEQNNINLIDRKNIYTKITHIILRLESTTNTLLNSMGQQLFAQNNIKDILIVILELIGKTPNNSLHTSESSQNIQLCEKVGAVNTEIIEAVDHSVIFDDADIKERIENLEERLNQKLETISSSFTDHTTTFDDADIKERIENLEERLNQKLETISSSFTDHTTTFDDADIKERIENLEERLNQKLETISSSIINNEKMLDSLNDSMNNNNKVNLEGYHMLKHHIDAQQEIIEQYRKKINS